MNANQWQVLGSNHVQSLRGFSVRRNDRNLLLYEAQERILPIEIEPGQSLAVYLTQSLKPLALPDTEVAKIKKHIEEALLFMEVRFEII